MQQSFLEYLRYTWQLLNGFRACHERALARIRDRDVLPFLDTSQPLRVLDLANGRLRPQYAILKAAGHRVYGIDLVNRPQLTWGNIAYSVARWFYNRSASLPAKISLDQTLLCGNVTALPFEDNSFDLATSIAAFEHFLDVPAVVKELARVVCSSGLVWVCIHLFTSLSGGHNLSFTEIPLRTIPAGVDPWDHLRQRRLPFSVPLNEWRKNQYLETFAQHFVILNDYCALREGHELLTPELEAELRTYSPDELTCSAYVIVAQKAP
jgi:SAM-dependent methyltransferase